MKKFIMFTAFLGLSFMSQAREIYDIKAEIYDNNKLIATPILTVYADQKGGISVDNLYELSMTLIPFGDNAVKIASGLTLNGTHMSPSFLVKLGGKASVTSQGKKLVLTVQKSKAAS